MTRSQSEATGSPLTERRKFGSPGQDHRQARERRALAAGRVCWFDWDMDGDLVMRADSAPGSLGLPVEGTGRDFFARIHAEDAERLRALLSGLQRGTRQYAFTFRLDHPAGRTLWLQDTGELEWDGDGRLVGVHGVTIDVSERRDAEAALRESEERFRAMSDHLPLIVWVHDAQGRQEFVNRTFCEYFGVSREEMRDGRWRLLTHPEDGTAYSDEFARCVRERRDFHATVRARAADGTWHRLESWGRARFSSAGEYLGHVGTSLDISERRQAEQRLSEALQRLTKLMDNTPLGVVEWDAEFKITRWSGQAEKMFGWTAQEMVGRYLADAGLVYAPDKPLVDRVSADLLDPANPYVISRNRNTTKSGEVIQCEWYNSVLRDESGRTMAVLSLVLDVSERERALEALREGDRRKDEFLAVLAHELRNPLAPIRNGLELLRLAKNNPGAMEQARLMMERQVAHMVRLIDDLLDVSRIARDKLELKKQPVNVAQAVVSALESSEPLIAAAQHEINLDLPAEALIVHGDFIRLAQVFTNLLNNAARYTPGGGHIAIGARRDGAAVEVTVQDDGVGIPHNMLEQVFEPFVQVERPSQGGLGLGLALSRKLIEMHDGSIHARSAGMGCGACFTVRLPALADARVPGAGSPDLDAAARRTRVLVVDDNVDAARSLAMVLELEGHEVDVATDGEKALEAAALRRPEIVILDLGMPNMDGYEVCRRLRASPATSDAMLIALTGYGQEADRRKSEEAGFAAHLVKPVELTELEALIRQRASSLPPA